MNAPRDLGPQFRAWMRDVPPMSAELPEKTLKQTWNTRQRRRWLWFLPGPKPTAGADEQRDLAQPPAPNQKTRGPLLAPIGGTKTMFSTTKLVGLAAVAALVGGLLVAVPLGTQQQTNPMPAAAPAAEPGEISPFSGTVRPLGQNGIGEIKHHDWGTSATGEQWTVRWETDDPRFTGVSTGFQNAYSIDPSGSWLRAYRSRLFTDEGSWLATGRAYQNPETTEMHHQEYAVGEGAYEGLYAMTTFRYDESGAMIDVEGAIFEGGLPATPEAAPDELPWPYGSE